MIGTVSLVNFKAFDDAEVPLGTLTLLSGLNGSGKSSIVQALGLLRQSADSGSLRSGAIALNGPLVAIGTARDLLYQGFQDATIGIGLSVDAQGGGTLDWKADVPNPEADMLACREHPSDWEKAEIGLFSPGFQLLRADRITPEPTYPRSQHAIGAERFLGAHGQYVAHFLLRYGEATSVDARLRHPSAPEAPQLLSQVNAWMQAFSPGVRVEPQAVAMTDLVRLAFAYRGTGAAYGEPMRPTNVGFGLTHALPVITACLAAEPGSLVVIENPEAQLHPRGQAAIGRLLALTASTGVQVVAESHSDHVLNGIRIAAKDRSIDAEAVRLHFFRREVGLAAVLESPVLGSDGRLSFWPENYFDEWERGLDRLLTPG